MTLDEHELAEAVARWASVLDAQVSDEDFLREYALVSSELLELHTDGIEFMESERARRFGGCMASYQRRFLALCERAEAEALVEATALGQGRTDFGRHTSDRLRPILRLIDVAACRRVVVVGCGAYPAAALFFHDAAPDSRIEAIDADADAAALGGRVAERHASPRLRVLCVDGLDYDYATADAVYVVNHVSPKRDVVTRVTAAVPDGAHVLVRDPFGAGRLLAESIDTSLPDGWQADALGDVDPHFWSRDLLIGRHGQ